MHAHHLPPISTGKLLYTPGPQTSLSLFSSFAQFYSSFIQRRSVRMAAQFITMTSAISNLCPLVNGGTHSKYQLTMLRAVYWLMAVHF
jgi:hypothetical protein